MNLEKFLVEYLESVGFKVVLEGAKLCRKHWVKHQDFCDKCMEEEREAAGHSLE